MAILLGWGLLGETITVEAVIGFMLIFTGFVLIKHRAMRDAVSDVRASLDER